MKTPKYSHVHSALASARFDPADAVWRVSVGEAEWVVYLDDSLARWEVFVDAVSARVFVGQSTWDSLLGKAKVAFEDDFMRAYAGSDKRELRRLDGEVYQASARRRAAMEGTAVAAPGDRIKDLQQRADEAVVAAAGVGGAPSALQLQVFAVRHAALQQDLEALEAEMARLRSAVDLSAAALSSALG